MAASSGVMVSGSGTTCFVGTQIRLVIAPSNGGAPMNRTFGQRLP